MTRHLAASIDVRYWRAPCKGGAFQWVQTPPGRRGDFIRIEVAWIASPAIMGAGDARAAMTLAGTYMIHSMILEKLGVHGFVPDVAMARVWYEKAKKFGSAEALGQVPAAERQLVPRPAALRQQALERPAVWRRGRGRPASHSGRTS